MNLIPLPYNIPFKFYHQMIKVMFAEMAPFCRQYHNFFVFSFSNATSEDFFSVSPVGKVKIRYSLESSAQCNSTEFSFIFLGHSVKAVTPDEWFWVYRTSFIRQLVFCVPYAKCNIICYLKTRVKHKIFTGERRESNHARFIRQCTRKFVKFCNVFSFDNRLLTYLYKFWW